MTGFVWSKKQERFGLLQTERGCLRGLQSLSTAGFGFSSDSQSTNQSPFTSPQKASLEATLRDIEMRYNMEIEKYNAIIMRLQEELSQIRSDIQKNGREYDTLLNIKVKLEAEIAEYRRLLDGGDFKWVRGVDRSSAYSLRSDTCMTLVLGFSSRLEDAVDLKKVQTKVVTVTQTLVDGKVVSESKDVKSRDNIGAF